MAQHHGDPPRYLTSPLLDRAGLPHLFTTRHFPGIMPPAEAGAPFGPAAKATLAALGLNGRPAAFLRQVHGATVIATRDGGRVGEGDGLLTDQPGLPLAVSTADCLPVLIYDAGGRRLAAVHAGWRGTLQSVVRAAARALIERGASPAALWAAVGPSIGPCCYEVDAPVVDRLKATFPRRWATWLEPTRPGRWMLDLWRANEDQLRAEGLSATRIENPRLCTHCRGDLFFSYRRGGGRGRLVTVAALPP